MVHGHSSTASSERYVDVSVVPMGVSLVRWLLYSIIVVHVPTRQGSFGVLVYLSRRFRGDDLHRLLWQKVAAAGGISLGGETAARLHPVHIISGVHHPFDITVKLASENWAFPTAQSEKNGGSDPS